MSYTWEEVMFGIDVKNEQARKVQQQRDIEQEAADESSAMSLWSLGLSLLGGALFGPPGYFFGKRLGTHGADYAYDWESMEVEEGKFNVAAAKEFNKTLDKAATDQDKGQILSTVLDLGKMYVQAGGLTAEPGELDWTTFGSGADEWTLFGRGEAASADYVPSLWSPNKDLLGNLGQLYETGSGLYAQDQSVSTLGRLGLDYYEAQQEKRKVG